MLGSSESEDRDLSAAKLFSNYSNLCDHNASLSQTDRWTDDLPWQYHALRSIAR